MFKNALRYESYSDLINLIRRLKEGIDYYIFLFSYPRSIDQSIHVILPIFIFINKSIKSFTIIL